MHFQKTSQKTRIAVYVAFVVLCFIAINNCAKNEPPVIVPDTGTPPKKHTIPYPEGYDTTSSGASAANGLGDHHYSPYFKHPDFFNMKSSHSLTIIPNFKTYQQTTEYHCGAAVALMVMYHYGITNEDELTIGKGLRTHMDPDGGPPTQLTEVGTTVGNMVRYFETRGWYVESSLTHNPFGEANYALFRKWVIDNLREGTPIMVEWVDWGGHWQNIIGFDTMGTDHFGSDILILADPYDTSDHYQDGYYVVNAERFFYMWFDYVYQPEGEQIRQWVIAKPKQ